MTESKRLERRATLFTLTLAMVMVASACGAGSSSSDGPVSARPSESGAATVAPSTAVSSVCPDPAAPPAEPSNPDSSISGEVVLWGWNNAAPQAVYEEFKVAYPNVTVEFVDVGTTDMGTKLLTSLRGGAGAPDIAMWEDAFAADLWEQPVVDLTPCLEPHIADFPSSKIRGISRPDGTILAAPWEAGPVQLLYRTDIFEKYGIDPTTLTTWEAYVAAGKALSAASGGTVHMLMSNIVPPPAYVERAYDTFLLLAQQNGGNLFDVDGNPQFTDAKNVEALELLKKFRDEGLTLNDVASDQAAYQVINDGTVASWLAPTWWKYYPENFAADTKGLWAAQPLPVFADGGARSGNNGGSSLVMPSQGENQAAAWAFLKFWLLRVESRKASFEAGGGLFENIYAPAAADPFFSEPDPFFGFPWLAQARELSDEIPAWYVSKDTSKVGAEFDLLLPDYFDGKIDAVEFLEQVQKAAVDGG